MEARGIRVDVELLRTIAKSTEEARPHSRSKRCGHEFKVNRPATTDGPLRRIGLTREEVKSGYSTTRRSRAIQDEHKIIALIFATEVEKLRGTTGRP